MQDTPIAKELADIVSRQKKLANLSINLPKSTRIITVSNQKGGVGKTTTVVNLAAAIAGLGGRVLVIDLDPQGNASTGLGIDHHSGVTGIYDVLTGEATLEQAIHSSPEHENIQVVPATLDLAGAEIELVPLENREFRLRDALTSFFKHQNSVPHFIFIDCPPSLGLLTVNALAASQEVLIPIQCEYYALEGLSQLIGSIDLVQQGLNPRLKLSSILLTMYDNRTNLSKDVADEVRNHFPAQTLGAVIPRNVRISEAPSFGKSVISYDKSSAGALSYLEAAAELTNKGA